MRKQFASTKDEYAFRDNLYRSVAAQFPGAALPYDADGTRPRGNLILDPATGYGLWLRYDVYKNRLEISCLWPAARLEGDTQTFGPNDIHPHESAPEITVDADKSPLQICADIKRRLLHDYARVFARCVKRRDEHEAYVKNINATAAKFAEVVGGKATGSHGGRSVKATVDFYGTVLPLCGCLEVQSDYSAIKLEVPNDKVEKLLEFLKTL